MANKKPEAQKLRRRRRPIVEAIAKARGECYRTRDALRKEQEEVIKRDPFSVAARAKLEVAEHEYLKASAKLEKMGDHGRVPLMDWQLRRLEALYARYHGQVLMVFEAARKQASFQLVTGRELSLALLKIHHAESGPPA